MLEQSRGALVHALMFRKNVLLYPVNPKQLARYRESYPGGGKNDPTDAMYLARMLRERITTLTAWQPDDATAKRGVFFTTRGPSAADAPDAGNAPDAAFPPTDWWNPSYIYRAPLTVTVPPLQETLQDVPVLLAFDAVAARTPSSS